MKTKILVSSEETDRSRFLIGTHDGVFHSDEVVACAILTLLLCDEKIEFVRSKDMSYLSKKGCDMLVDVGHGTYDHHQPGGNGKRKNGVPYATAGLVWKEFGKQLVTICCRKLYGSYTHDVINSVFKEIDEKLIQEVDKEDNGIPTDIHTFSFIPSFLPVYHSRHSSFDKAFKLALNVTIPILEHAIFDSIGKMVAQEAISNMIKNNELIDNHILEIPTQNFPWLDSVCYYNNTTPYHGDSKQIYFVIFPYPSGGWAAQCVPPSTESKFDQKVPFPKEWAGQTDKLAQISGVKNATFCHNGCFFVRAKTKEGIISLCNKALLCYENNL